MLDTIRESWSWIGLEPLAVVATSKFGNLIVRATDGEFWRICPEELSCEVIARNAGEFETLWANDDFQLAWQMAQLINVAVAKLGPVPDQRCYCLKFPEVLGGKYDEDNLGTISRRELIAFAGDFARQIKNFPDATRIQFVFTK